MSKQDVELKPCPFCGSDDVAGCEQINYRYSINCGKCGITVQGLGKAEVMERWNRRPHTGDRALRVDVDALILELCDCIGNAGYLPPESARLIINKHLF